MLTAMCLSTVVIKLILSANGQNIYPEELRSKLNNMPFVMESLVIDSNGKLIALVCPDYDAVDAEGLDPERAGRCNGRKQKLLNSLGASYESVSKSNYIRMSSKKHLKKH